MTLPGWNHLANRAIGIAASAYGMQKYVSTKEYWPDSNPVSFSMPSVFAFPRFAQSSVQVKEAKPSCSQVSIDVSLLGAVEWTDRS
jgi:hypothetical protein